MKDEGKRRRKKTTTQLCVNGRQIDIEPALSLTFTLNLHYIALYHCRDSLLVRKPDSWSKGCKFESRFFSSRLCALTLIRCPFYPILPQWHVKDLGHFAKSAGGRLHLNTHTPFTWRRRSGLTMPLSRHSVGTYRETSSHATRQGTLGHSRLSSLSHFGRIMAERVELVCAS